MATRNVPGSRSLRDLGAVLALLVLVAAFVPAARPMDWFTDFNAFYCGGDAIRAGADPYRAEPLGACERRPKPAGFHAGVRRLTLPAPLPPYALAPFVPLAMLPYGAAAGAWFVLLLLALGITIEAMHRSSALPRATLFAVFAPIEGYSSLFLGETAPLAIASIALATMFVGCGNHKRAALALGPALIAPHVGLPAALTLFVCVPRTRPLLAVMAASLAALSLAFVGLGTTLEYLRDVVPAHALSEAASTQQLSLTGLLHIFGVPIGLALHLGSASSVAALFVSLALGRKLAARNVNDGLIVALPSALALAGGVFIHVTQMAAALPAALLLFTRSSAFARRHVGCAIIVLALPWDQPFLGLIFVPLAAGAAFAMARGLLEENNVAALLAAAGAGGAVLAFDLALLYGAPFPVFHLPPIHPHDLAEINWGINVRAIAAWGPQAFDLARLPSWLAIGTIAAALIRFASIAGRGLTESDERRPCATRLVSH